MPVHWGHKKLNIVSKSSPTGTQFLQAVGSAEATLRAKLRPRHHGGVPEGRSRVLSPPATGTTSEGEFWESLNTACNLKLPVVYLIEDNGYAISVPGRGQYGRRHISKLVRRLPQTCTSKKSTGAIFSQSYDAMQRAVDYAASAKDLRLSTRTSSARTHTRCPMMK